MKATLAAICKSGMSTVDRSVLSPFFHHHPPRRSVKALFRTALAIVQIGVPTMREEALQLLQQAELLDPQSSEVRLI